MRRVLATLTALVTATIGLALATPAHADSVPFHFRYDHATGSTYLAKPNTTVTLPTFAADVYAELNTYTVWGSLQIPDLTVHARGVTAVVRLAPQGDFTGTLDGVASTVDLTLAFKIQVLEAYADARPHVNLVGTDCGTGSVITTNLTNEPPIQLGPGTTTLTGTYTIPAFTHCRSVTNALTRALAGSGNVLTLNLTDGVQVPHEG